MGGSGVLDVHLPGVSALPPTAAELAELRRALDGVPGWLTDEEATTLFRLARSCTGRGAIVEIGSYKGRSTICLALGSRAGPGVPVHAIDPGHAWERFSQFEQHVERAGIRDLVRPIGKLSQDALGDVEPEAIELLFIDGSHKLEMVTLDFDLWTPRLVEGGMLVMHDTNSYFPGSCRVAEQRMYRGHGYRGVRFVFSSMTIGQKTSHLTGPERAANLASLAVKRSFDVFVSVRHRIPDPVRSAGRTALRHLQRVPSR